MILIKKPLQLDLIFMPLKRQIAVDIKRKKKKKKMVFSFQRVLIRSGLYPRSGIISLLLRRSVGFFFFPHISQQKDQQDMPALTLYIKELIVRFQGAAALGEPAWTFVTFLTLAFQRRAVSSGVLWCWGKPFPLFSIPFVCCVKFVELS